MYIYSLCIYLLCIFVLQPKDPEEETKENGDQMPEYDEETKKVIECKHFEMRYLRNIESQKTVCIIYLTFI